MEQPKRIMGALVRQPPKPHDQMKLGKLRGKTKKSPARAETQIALMHCACRRLCGGILRRAPLIDEIQQPPRKGLGLA